MPPLEFHLANWPTALLAFIPMLVNIGMLVYGYRKLTLDAQNVLYLLFVTCALNWQAFDLMVRLSETAETAAVFRGLFCMGQLLAINFGLHFVMLFIEQERVAWSAWFWALLYVPPYLQIGATLSGLQREVLVYRPGWGWLADPAHLSGSYVAYLGYESVLSLSCMVLLIDHLRRVWPDPARREAAGILALGMGVVVSTGVLFEAILPSVGLPQWPVTSTAGVAFSAAILVGQLRYRLFDVSTPAAAKAVVETVTDPLLIATIGGELLFANGGAVQNFGLDPRRIGTYDLTRMVSQTDGGFREAWQGVGRGQRFPAVEALIRMPDGGERPYLLSLAPIPLNRAGDAGVAVVAHDIGEIKAYEHALEQARDEAESANRSKSEFLASMSHELRTPLNVIIGYSELLEEEVDDAEVSRDLSKIKTSGKHLLQLINDILDLSKVEAGHLEVMAEALDVVRLLIELEGSLLQLAGTNGNTLQQQLPLDLPKAFADPMRVRQAVLNLVSNAAKFCEAGTITVAVRADEGVLQIDVTDTGIGMSPEQAGKLFSRFSQVHEDNHERYGGTGLGLALSRSLCRLMKGDLILLRTAPGEGSTFRIVLPVHP